MHYNSLKVCGFFCVGGGMSFGMGQAGIRVLAGLDSDENCRETYLKNNPEARFILADITRSETSILSDTGVEVGDDNLVFIGCSPCQYWSIIHTDREKSKKIVSYGSSHG